MGKSPGHPQVYAHEADLLANNVQAEQAAYSGGQMQHIPHEAAGSPPQQRNHAEKGVRQGAGYNKLDLDAELAIRGRARYPQLREEFARTARRA